VTDFGRVENDYFEALQRFQNDQYVLIELWPGEPFVGHLKVTIDGAENTPYEGGRFVFEIKTFNNYPFYPPGVFCHTKIWHPNIDIDRAPPTDRFWKDNVCFDIINPDRIGKVDSLTNTMGWTPTKDLVMLIECLKLMIHCYPPFFNPDDPLNREAGAQYKFNQAEFEKKAKEWTKLYA
jgi:ubiquitin-protein ligase